MEHEELRCDDPDEQRERLHAHLLMLNLTRDQEFQEALEVGHFSVIGKKINLYQCKNFSEEKTEFFEVNAKHPSGMIHYVFLYGCD
ncbi:MAG: hypothetical protein NPINA01_31400 [Nitrospinaceae bacterium]|nr:MAG: hypothetical protein NPINA01_31400 [Nitrospinaceae bacterium]